jgi:hypothetical protein
MSRPSRFTDESKYSSGVMLHGLLEFVYSFCCAAAPWFSSTSAIPKKFCRGVLLFLLLALSVSVRCSVRVLVTSSTLEALKTLHWWPFIISFLSDRQPHTPALFLSKLILSVSTYVVTIGVVNLCETDSSFGTRIPRASSGVFICSQ